MFTKTMCCFRDQESHFENTQVWMSEAPPSVRIMVARFWKIIPPRTTEKIETARTSENDCRDRPFRFRSWITRTRPLQGRLSVYHTSERKGRYSLLSLCIHSELLKKRLPSLRPGAQKRPQRSHSLKTLKFSGASHKHRPRRYPPDLGPPGFSRQGGSFGRAAAGHQSESDGESCARLVRSAR